MTSTEATEQFLEIQNVRITPSKLVLRSACDSKNVVGKFTIQNVGKKMTFIRIAPPNVHECLLECIIRGTQLSPGLQIVRVVKFIEGFTPNIICVIPIYINDERYDYEVQIDVFEASITIHPLSIDVGCIQLGTICSVPSIFVTNGGNEKVFCYTEVGKMSAAVFILDPKKADIMEIRISTTLHVKAGGTFKTVRVTGAVAPSKLEAIHLNATENFTFIEFPATYFGLTSYENLTVRNRSILRNLFSTMGEEYGNLIALGDRRDDESDFLSFNAYPLDGIFEPNETKIFKFTFTPHPRCDGRNTIDEFFFCTMRIKKFRGHVFELTESASQFFDTKVEAFDDYKYSNVVTTAFPFCGMTESMVHTRSAETFYNLSKNPEEDFIRVYLYGTAEHPSVDVIPDELIDFAILYNTQLSRVLQLKNNSKVLPIIVHYQKTPFVHVKPENFFLKPQESLQVIVHVTPKSLGKIESKIVFHLLYHSNSKEEVVLQMVGKIAVPISVDVLSSAFPTLPKPQLNTGLSPNYIKDVGKYCQGVRFNTGIPKLKCITVYNCTVIDKNCKDLVAFPNDTQQSLRPCRLEETCRTLFARKPRYIQPIDTGYELSQFDNMFKKEVSHYYTKYLRSEFTKRNNRPMIHASDYSLTDQRKNLCTDIRCLGERPIKEQYKKHCCIPLTPIEMEHIVVNPNLVNTGQVVVSDIYPFSINIRNNNNFAIRIFIKSDKMHISSVNGKRHVLGEMNELTINFICRFMYLGHNNSTIELIINESMAISIPVFAEVVNKYLVPSCFELHLCDGNNPLYIDLSNNLSVPVAFQWTLSNSDFGITPMTGTVRPRKTITCTVCYLHGMNATSECDAYIQSSSESVELIILTAKFKTKSLTVPEEGVIFKDLSLNIPRFQTVILRNPSDIPLMFNISQNDFEGCITIMPQNGTVEKFCSSALFLTAKFNNCVIFDGFIQIKTQSGVINLRIYGNVVYPKIDINPKELSIPKICGSTTTKIPFVITNRSVSAVTVRFMMEEFEMFLVSTSASIIKPVVTDEVFLERGSSQRFFLHFMPSGALAYFFYLPIIINDILGPPIYKDVVSTKVMYYLNESIAKSTMVRTPVCVPCVKVQSLSLPQKIDLLKTMIKIITSPKRYQDHFVLKIHNPQIDEESVCLRIDDLRTPFEIDYTDKNILRNNCSIVCDLKPDQTISLTIYFKPNEFDFGSYRVVIPVYIRSDHSPDPHRFITVLGIYQKPEITMEMNTDIDLKKDYQSDAYMNYVPMSAPINVPLVSTKKLTFRHHLSNCEIDVNVALVDELSVTVDHESKQYIDDDEYTIEVVIAWTPKIEKVFCFNWKITCTCGGFWQQLGCNIIESSFMTMPAFCSKYFSMYSKGNLNLAININTSIDMIYPQYPFFKTNDPDTNALFETSLTVIESWLHSQIFYGEYNYQIPNDICHVDYRPVPEHLLKRNVRMSMCPLAQILITLAGPKVFELLDLRDGMFPDRWTDEDKIVYLQEVYSKILQFVGEKGGSFTYLQPEYLFSYNLYKLYRERIYNQLTPPFQLTEYVIEFADFTSLACRSWFDVILQMYKVFVINKIYTDFKKKKPLLNSSSSSLTPMTKFESFEHVNKYPLFLSESESFILNWFEFMFNSYKDEVWDMSLNYREVGLFDESLKDGVVFATVTLAYCPYMKPFLKNIYLDACTYEEMLHNAIFIVRCWKMLNFNFQINPRILVTAHSLGCIMQMAYLYETLPFTFPIEEIVFEAPLSKHVKRQVILTNTNSFLIAYKPILLSEDGCFNINEEVFEIKPKKSKTITVSYFAKFCRITEGTLLFSGEVSGYRYAKNKCVTLLGKPDLAYATTIIKYPAHLYSVPDFTFTIKSPYPQAATYHLKVALDDPLSREKLPNALFYHERHRLACSRIMLTNSSFDFDQDGVCVLTGYLIPIATYNTTAWLYFTNKTVGDFAIKLITIIKDCREYELLTVNIPANFTQKHKSKLKKKLYVEIPHRNKALWKTIRMMLFRITTGDEKSFWNRMIDTTAGTNLLHRIMFISIPKGKISNTFVCTSGEYEVMIPQAHHHAISLPYVLTFPDECSASTLKVPITVKEEKAIPDHTIMTLFCEKLFRKRTYMIFFDKAAMPTSKELP